MNEMSLAKLLTVVYMERAAEDMFAIIAKLQKDLPGEEWPEPMKELQQLAYRIELHAKMIRDSVN